MKEIPFITEGLDFTYRIKAQRLGFNKYVNVSFEEISGLTVNHISLPSTKTPVSYSIDEYGRLIIPISGEGLACNTYGLELTGFYNNGNWRRQEVPTVEIVKASSQDNYALQESDDRTIDITITLGETTVSSRVFQSTIDAVRQNIADSEGVGDVKINGRSIVEVNPISGKKEVNLQKDMLGKVDDVKVNGESVLNAANEANIEVPTTVEELSDSSDFAKKTDLQTMQGQVAQAISDTVEQLEQSIEDAAVSEVEATVDNNTGTPEVDYSFENGKIQLVFKNLKGETGAKLQFSDLNNEDKEQLRGRQGDSAVYNPDAPDTPDFVMANSMGISTTKSMTQKAVTNEVERIDNMLGKIITTHLAADFSNGKRSVSSQTGEYSSASTNSYATEIVVTSQTCEVKYPAITYNGQFGYAFMGDNGFVSGAKHTNSIVEDGYVVIGRDSILEALGAGAKWLRITVNDTPEANEGFDVKTLSFGGRLEDLEEKASTIEGIGTAVEGIASGMENLEGEVDSLAEDVEGVADFLSDETGTSTQDFDETILRNVDSTTGDFVPTSVAGRCSGEYHIKDGDIAISYGGTSYTGNYGWALLTEGGTYVHGEKTTSTQTVSIDLTSYPTAKIFRWSGNSNSKTITIVGRQTKQVRAVVKAKYETFGGAFDGTLNFHFTFVKPNVNNQYATDVEKLTNTEVNGAGLLRLAKNYSRDGVPTPLIIFFIGSTGYSSYSTTEFKEEYLPYIDYLTMCGYNVMSAHGFYEGVSSRNFACPVGMAAVSNAYRWVTEHYNISRDGVYVYGRSFGGSNVVSFGYNSNIKTRAAAMLNCYIGDISNEYSNAPEKVKEFIFDNDPNFEWETAYVAANLEKALPWSNLLRGIVDFGTRADMVYALMQAGNTMNPEHAKYKDPTTIHRVQPFPMKMWTAEDDSGITRGMKWYRETVISTGGRCELRIMPSNYTDEDRVPGSDPHHICDTAGPIYETLTTKLGYVCENIPVAYKEMVDWFDNN